MGLSLLHCLYPTSTHNKDKPVQATLLLQTIDNPVTNGKTINEMNYTFAT